MDNLQKNIEKEVRIDIRPITRSLGGNNIPYIRISKPSIKCEEKKNIVILGRQHSGEIWSSFIL